MKKVRFLFVELQFVNKIFPSENSHRSQIITPTFGFSGKNELKKFRFSFLRQKTSPSFLPIFRSFSQTVPL